ncbi:MAG: DNA replication protein [Firmicutes bacterium]|nr:DNA replication protein [Bacillota bacterium]
MENLNLSEREQIIYDLLPAGHQKPITLKKLSCLAHMNQREVREIIYTLVVERGLPVGSSTEPSAGGYFIIEDPKDLEVATRHLTPRAKKIFKRARALERIARERFDQNLRLVFEE